MDFALILFQNFRERAESLLTDNFELDMDNKCSYEAEEPMMTTCAGTDRDYCVVLHSQNEG